jgi:hypothetical protein
MNIRSTLFLPLNDAPWIRKELGLPQVNGDEKTSMAFASLGAVVTSLVTISIAACEAEKVSMPHRMLGTFLLIKYYCYKYLKYM